MSNKNKKRGLQCVEGLGDEAFLGNSSLTDSDDDGVDAGLLTWVASLDKVSETQLSNLESEPQLDANLENTTEGFESQGTQDGDTREVKKRKKNPTQPAPFPRVQTRRQGPPPPPIKGKKTMKLS
jgi:hypothetical protein